MVEMGGDASKVNPQVPVDLVIDHSVQVDVSGADPNALDLNLDIEYYRHGEIQFEMGSKIASKLQCCSSI